MGQIERLQQMREWIKTSPEISLDQLMQEYQISRDTARRDVIVLEQEGEIIRVKNGLVRASGTLAYEQRTEKPENRRFGQRASRHVQANDRLLLDAATTVSEMARALPPYSLQVITNSLDIADHVGARRDIELYVTGGRFDRHARSLSGIKTADDILNYQVDCVFLGACGLTEEGLFAEQLEEAVVKKAMIRSATRVIVLADHTKFNKRFLHKVCDWEQIDVLVTDQVPDATWQERLDHYHVDLDVTEEETT
ncbi:DeoR/GlpR family DNA-binding transcription regulator [Exiguobacterium sp.]|uniref:DeoR/GlpR family DNA-binding transcription regulator n=1 Tax=Exiguobacterium sp. TaxID=44751 RepID=UPI0028A9D159|nr:DeoR/GlpR family DNA-binding transcription regulator [Exiguobacterium sp.]